MRNAVLLLSLWSCVAQAAPRSSLPFIEDDYPRALAEAQKRSLPLFVDAWAPWCHTCRFMRAYVFTDPSLRRVAKRFIWLSIDTEQAKNAPFLDKYPIDVWPTLMVIDPGAEQAALRWAGSLDVAHLIQFLGEGERVVRESGRGAVVALAGADRLAAEKRWREAAAIYRLLLPALPAAEQRRATVSLLSALAQADDPAACVQTATELLPGMPRGPLFAAAVSSALGCAGELKGKAALRAQQGLMPLGQEALALPDLLADDRSGLYLSLVALRHQAGDTKGAKQLAADWLTFLEDQASRAPTPEQRAVFDPHRVEAALALGAPERAIAALETSERELPHDYNPPARLAMLYDAAGRGDDALAAIRRALKRAYGPRLIRLLDFEAGLLQKRGDKAGARHSLGKALALAQALPATAPRRAARIAALEARLGKLR